MFLFFGIHSSNKWQEISTYVPEHDRHMTSWKAQEGALLTVAMGIAYLNLNGEKSSDGESINAGTPMPVLENTIMTEPDFNQDNYLLRKEEIREAKEMDSIKEFKNGRWFQKDLNLERQFNKDFISQRNDKDFTVDQKVKGLNIRQEVKGLTKDRLGNLVTSVIEREVTYRFQIKSPPVLKLEPKDDFFSKGSAPILGVSSLSNPIAVPSQLHRSPSTKAETLKGGSPKKISHHADNIIRIPVNEIDSRVYSSTELSDENLTRLIKRISSLVQERNMPIIKLDLSGHGDALRTMNKSLDYIFDVLFEKHHKAVRQLHTNSVFEIDLTGNNFDKATCRKILEKLMVRKQDTVNNPAIPKVLIDQAHLYSVLGPFGHLPGADKKIAWLGTDYITRGIFWKRFMNSAMLGLVRPFKPEILLRRVFWMTWFALAFFSPKLYLPAFEGEEASAASGDDAAGVSNGNLTVRNFTQYLIEHDGSQMRSNLVVFAIQQQCNLTDAHLARGG